MRNSINDLNNILFEQLERLMDDDLTEEEYRKEIIRSRAVTDVANSIIKSGELSVRAAAVSFRYESEFDRVLNMPTVLKGV